MNPTEIEASIDELSIELAAIREKENDLVRRIEKAKSIAFIQENNITKDMVVDYDDKSVPHFYHIRVFAYWLKDNSGKPWLCWNGFLYKTSEVLNDKVYLNSIARYEDL